MSARLFENLYIGAEVNYRDLNLGKIKTGIITRIKRNGVIWVKVNGRSSVDEIFEHKGEFIRIR